MLKAFAFLQCVLTVAAMSVNISSRTCPIICQSQYVLAQAADIEVFGDSSRCFATRFQSSPSSASAAQHRCVAVSCASASCRDDMRWRDEHGFACVDWMGYACGSAAKWGYSQQGIQAVIAKCPSSCGLCGYKISLSNGASATCSGRAKWAAFSGAPGEVLCDDRAEVCSNTDQVLPSSEENRRAQIDHYLTETFDREVAVTLRAAYVSGRFNPHPPAEGGLPGEYLIEHGIGNCDWAASTLGSLDRVDMANLGITSFIGVSTTALLDMLRQGCASFVEQGVAAKASSYSETLNAPWGIDSLDGTIDNVYRRFYGGAGVHVFVFDTGIDSSHVELKDRVGEGKDFTGSPYGTQDKDGHGTHCAGTIAGKTVGVAPDAIVVPVKVLGDDGVSNGRSVLQGVDFILNQRKALAGPIVVSGSLGGSKSDVTNGAWRKMVDAGITVIVAAGNENQDVANVSPASETSLITVGAIDSIGNPAPFSNFGRGLDIWAPGVQITSAKPGGGLTNKSGTSMAGPHVAGVAALLLEKNPNWSHQDIQTALLQECLFDRHRLKMSTGFTVRTWAGPGPNGNTSSQCQIAFELVDDRSLGSSESEAKLFLLLFLLGLAFLSLVTFCLWRRGHLGFLRKCCGQCNYVLPYAVKQTPAQVGVVPQQHHRPAPKPESPALVEPLGKQVAPLAAKITPAEKLSVLEGSKWDAFCVSYPNLSSNIQVCDACLRDATIMENRLEDVWAPLRRNLRNASSDGVLEGVEGKLQVWFFVLEVASRRKFLGSQAKEIGAILDSLPAWARVANQDAELNHRRNLLLGKS